VSSLQNEVGKKHEGGRERERERDARRNKIEESGRTADEGDKSELGWREAGRYCYGHDGGGRKKDEGDEEGEAEGR